jgi:hypothetical protein
MYILCHKRQAMAEICCNKKVIDQYQGESFVQNGGWPLTLCYPGAHHKHPPHPLATLSLKKLQIIIEAKHVEHRSVNKSYAGVRLSN